MGGLREMWCFCKGLSKSEKMKAAIFSGKAPALVLVSRNGISGTGFLIHRSLMLTTHVNLPSVSAAEGSEIRLQNGGAASLVPHRFFITSSVLDLTIVGLDAADGDSNSQGHPHYLKTCSKPNLDLGSGVYLLGYTETKELTVGEGKVVIATDNLIKLSTDGVTWSPGSAGLDPQGNLAFMICDPMKLATSPNTKSSSTSTSTSSSIWKKDHPMQFGIPIPIICDWLNQHWEGSLDGLNKPKLPLIRLMSTGQKSDHSCASFTLRRVFKSTEAENDATPSSSNTVSKPRDQIGPGCSAAANISEEETPTDTQAAHVQGIPTPEIYETPKLTSNPLRKREGSQIQLLDINFPPRIAKPAISPQSTRRFLQTSDENFVKEPLMQSPRRQENQVKDSKGSASPAADAEIASAGSVDDAHSEVQSSSYPVEASEMHNGYSSEGETLYSAETAESRNYPSPPERKFQPVGRSQSCVDHNRWGAPVQRNPVARRALLEQQRSFIHGRKMYSQGATSQRSNDYCSPTMSSIRKKRNSEQQPVTPIIKVRQAAVHSSPRWNF